MSRSFLRARLASLNRLCAYDHCRLPLPWFVWKNRDDPASRLRRRILAIDAGRPACKAGAGLTAVAAGLHFFRGTREILLVWRRLSAPCRQACGVSGARQLAGLFKAVFRYNFPPMLYYRARLFRVARANWHSVFTHTETTLLLALFEADTARLGLWTKNGWAAFCAAEGIAAVPIAATALNGEVTVNHPAFLQPGRDLFLKPDRGYSGRGGVMLEWDAAARGWHALGAVAAFVPGDGLLAFLRNHSRDASVVVQPRLRNSPSLADLTPRALVNARIITLRAADGTVSVLMAALRLPPDDQPTSDVVATTMCVRIGLDTGVLGPAELPPPEFALRTHHPFTGARIEGRLIPEWPQMRAQALAAHQRLPFMPSIGWDLVATEDGVFILEANAVWNGNLAQHWGRAPLGETAWPAIMLAALDARSA